jgi:hypothetical protein
MPTDIIALSLYTQNSGLYPSTLQQTNKNLNHLSLPNYRHTKSQEMLENT